MAVGKVDASATKITLFYDNDLGAGLGELPGDHSSACPLANNNRIPLEGVGPGGLVLDLEPVESFARVLESWVWSRIAHRLPGWIRVLRIKVAEEDGAGEGFKGAKELPLEPECLFVCLVWFGFQW